MLKFSSARKNKIALTDYDFRKDIENRLLMSKLSVFEVEVLEEVVNSSLKLDLPSLTAALEACVKDVIEVVDKLSRTGLLKRQDQLIFVDKEMRKYYEFQTRKFDNNFRPNLHFLQGLLGKVPIHILPTWYSIPRTSTNIFDSIIEKYLLTPRVFQRYLLELNLGDPIIQGIIDDVHEAPDFKVRSRDLRHKYQLDRETFEEYMLHLEFNFLCCLSYHQIDDQWKEVVTPFHEWRQHLRFIRDTMPEAINGKIEQVRPGALTFAQDVKNTLLAIRQSSPLPTDFPKEYLDWILYKITGLGLAHREGDKLRLTDDAQEWEEMNLEDVALTLYRHPKNPWLHPELRELSRMERECREVERSLERVADSGWVRFREFIKGVMAAVRGAQEVTLQQVGRRWAYTRPTYTREQVTFIREMISERFFEAGFVDIGRHNDDLCFRVTPFGRSMLAL